jgi:hypothetical protein
MTNRVNRVQELRSQGYSMDEAQRIYNREEIANILDKAEACYGKSSAVEFLIAAVRKLNEE